MIVVEIKRTKTIVFVSSNFITFFEIQIDFDNDIHIDIIKTLELCDKYFKK